jgi:chemotaxis protein MotB
MQTVYKGITSLLIIGVLGACVPSKKYNELLEREKVCAEELTKYKNSSLDFEGKFKDLDARYAVLNQEVETLKQDTSEISGKYRQLRAIYDKIIDQNEQLENNIGKLRLAGAKETATLQADLEAKNLELQRKEDALIQLENELNSKMVLLAEREKRVNELEEIIQRKDEAVAALKNRVANALIGFENKGLSVVQKDGKIYVSLEAKLLFNSGSTLVEAEGKKALIQLAKVLENEKDIEIIVEGHTDTDKLSSASHPKSNWELSVLRATSVIDILLGNSKMNPKQLMAAGRGEFHPVDEKDKAKNRRIEIIISPNLNELFDIINNK